MGYNIIGKNKQLKWGQKQKQEIQCLCELDWIKS